MILTCPECRARFLVPDTAISPAGRSVRCGKCRHEWHVSPPPAAASATPAPAKKPQAPASARETPDIDRLMEEGSVAVEAPPEAERVLRAIPPGSALPARRKRLLALHTMMMSLLIAALLLLAIGLGMLTFAPALLGFHSSAGLTLKDVSMRREVFAEGERFGAQTRYVVEGSIQNATSGEIPTPQVRLVVMSGEGRVLRRWLIPHRPGTLTSGEQIGFNASFPAPGDADARVRVDIGNALELLLRSLP